MIKLTMYECDLIRHLEYFQENVVTALKKLLCNYTGDEAEFIEYLVNQAENLAIGPPEKLREIIKYIEKKGFDKKKHIIKEVFKKQYSRFSSNCSNWNPYNMKMIQKARTCPYCNRQYITMINKNRRVRADIDHFWPQSEYPYLSMSIYNYVPCCRVCNSSSKGKQLISVNARNPYEFSMDEEAEFLYKYYENNNPILFREKSTYWKEDVQFYDSTFNINLLYQHHSDIAKQILDNHEKYNETWINDIVQKASLPSVTKQDLYSLIIGHTVEKKDILKEPLGKFKRDIVRQIWGDRVLSMVTGELYLSK